MNRSFAAMLTALSAVTAATSGTLTAEVVLASSSALPGGSVDSWVILTNTGSEAMYFAPGCGSLRTLAVRRTDGQRVRWIGGHVDVVPADGLGMLGPGQSRAFFERLDEGYDLIDPGAYGVRLECPGFTGSHGGTNHHADAVVSAETPFEVIAPLGRSLQNLLATARPGSAVRSDFRNELVKTPSCSDDSECALLRDAQRLERACRPRGIRPRPEQRYADVTQQLAAFTSAHSSWEGLPGLYCAVYRAVTDHPELAAFVAAEIRRRFPDHRAAVMYATQDPWLPPREAPADSRPSSAPNR